MAGHVVGSVVRGSVDPTGGDGIDPYSPRQAGGQTVGEGGNTAFGCGVAFRIWLGHEGPGGRDIDDAGTGIEVGKEQEA